MSSEISYGSKGRRSDIERLWNIKHNDILHNWSIYTSTTHTLKGFTIIQDDSYFLISAHRHSPKTQLSKPNRNRKLALLSQMQTTGRWHVMNDTGHNDTSLIGYVEPLGRSQICHKHVALLPVFLFFDLAFYSDCHFNCQEVLHIAY